MHSNDLQWRLESWLQSRYGPRAVLASKPLDLRARATLPISEPVTWLAIAAKDGNVPPLAGIRRVPSENDHRQFDSSNSSNASAAKSSSARIGASTASTPGNA